MIAPCALVCRTCGEDIDEDAEAWFVEANGHPTEQPRCTVCHERAVRGVARRNMDPKSLGRPVPKPPGTASKKYHGTKREDVV